MSEIEDVLLRVEQLVRDVRVAEADERLRDLLIAVGPTELRVWNDELRATITAFLPKRRRALTALLDELQRTAASASSAPRAPSATQQTTRQEAGPRVPPVTSQLAPLEETLRELSQNHIFQWATHYRDELGQWFSVTLDAPAPDGIESRLDSTREAFYRHSREIFSKGYLHVSPTAGATHARQKAIGGLQRFLDLPVEFYSARLNNGVDADSAVILRRLTSSILSGILGGFASIDLGELHGTALLGSNPRTWLHNAAFMSGDHLASLADIPLTDTLPGCIGGMLVPLAQSLDQLVAEASGYVPLPAMAQYIPGTARLDISLQPASYAPERELTMIQCHLGAAPLPYATLRDALGRRVGLLIAAISEEALSDALQDTRFDDLLVTARTNEHGLYAVASDQLRPSLESAIYRHNSPRLGNRPLEYNFAREFPLNNPFLTRYYHVVRTSVTDMLRTFEKRNGVRLWCSVRRSGKTTAGLDLESPSADSFLISQTCDSTGLAANDSRLYESICEAIAGGSQLPPTFLSDALADCAPERQLDRRSVLVLDEYETLFGQLRTAAIADERLRYTVVQPLLNQLVAFAKDNLLVFLGQQPNAHFILMDQNQLSPYVEQDAFPLFTYSARDGGEFSELLRKILRQRATFDSDFAHRIFLETSGHPYLTVNIMVEFVEWLIKNRRPSDALHFTGEDASNFATRMLRRDHISVSPEYEFFREGAIPQALSPNGRKRAPWLFAMYSLIRQISLDDPVNFTCSREEFPQLVKHLGLTELGLSAESLLNTGTQANFLTFTDRIVAPRIRLLGRIASVSTPALD